LSIHKEQMDNDIVKAHMNEHIQQQRWQANMQTRPMNGEAGGMPQEPIEAGPQQIGGLPSSGGVPGGMGELPINIADVIGQ
jgi:hypothetical protein